MKKHMFYSVLAGIIAGGISRDFSCGPFLGLVWGLMIGVPISLFAVLVLGILKKEESKFANRICSIACAAIVFIAIYIGNNPLPTTIFKLNIANPIPPSVRNIKGCTKHVFIDFSQVLRFQISEGDLSAIIKANEFTKIENPEFNERGLSSETKSNSMPYDIPWFEVRSIKHPTVYMHSLNNERLQYLIYDSKNAVAYYVLLTF